MRRLTKLKGRIWKVILLRETSIFGSPVPFPGARKLFKRSIAEQAADPNKLSLGERVGIDISPLSCLKAKHV